MQIKSVITYDHAIELRLVDGEQEVRIEYTEDGAIHITDSGPGKAYAFMIVDTEKKDKPVSWDVLVP